MSRQVHVCLGSSCRRNGSPEIWEQLQQELAGEAEIELKRYICFGACGVGPNMLMMPERIWYSYVMATSVPQVADAMRQGKAIPGLANHVPPLIRDAICEQVAQRQAASEG